MVDVKSNEVETPGLIADRIRSALEVVPADRLVINPDCGLRNLTGPVARAKLAAMAGGAAAVRAELSPAVPAEPHDGHHESQQPTEPPPAR